MTANESSTHPDFDDDIPDLSTPEWKARFDSVEVKRGKTSRELAESVDDDSL